MDEFEPNLNEEKNLDEKVNDMSKEEQKVMELDMMRRKRAKILKEADEVERKYFERDESVENLWNKGMEEIVEIYNDGRELSQTKKKVWDALRDTKIIDMYKRTANKKLKNIERLANKLDKNIYGVKKRLYGKNGGAGIVTELNNLHQIITAKADARVATKKMIDQYEIEISKKQQELESLYTKARENTSNQFLSDIEYTQNKIKEISNDLAGMKRDYIMLGTAVQRFHRRIKTKSTMVTALENLYNNALLAQGIFESEIEIVREYIGDFNVINVDLIELSKDMSQATKFTEKLVNVENTLGTKVEETTSKIYEDTKVIMTANENKPYLDKMETQSNNIKKDMNLELDEITKQYATIPYVN